MNKEFEYQGYHFIPVRKLPENKNLYIYTEKMLGMNRYHFEWSRVEWDINDFYKASGCSEMDIFQCVENGIFYIPGENELFGWIDHETDTVWMNQYILNVIHAVLDYKRYISSHYMATLQKGKDIEADTRKYYYGLQLPYGMKKNNEDFKRILSYGSPDSMLQKMDEMSCIELSSYFWKKRTI